jgi:hypothetical protein
VSLLPATAFLIVGPKPAEGLSNVVKFQVRRTPDVDTPFAPIGQPVQEPQLSAIDSWMGENDVGARPEAIRRLVELGLKAKGK